jgi:hypothetical protein
MNSNDPTGGENMSLETTDALKNSLIRPSGLHKDAKKLLRAKVDKSVSDSY